MPETTPSPAVSAIQQIPVDQIKPSRHQARKDFDEEGIKQLAISIDKEDLIQPITLRAIKSPLTTGEGGGEGVMYEVISGERRLRAVKILGRPTIEARVIEVVNEAAACAKGLVENLQRKDLNPMEEAEGFAELTRLDPTYWTKEQIGLIAGHDRSYVSQSLGFIKLPASVQEGVRRLTLNRSQILEIMRLSTPEAQIEAAEKAKELSIKETRKLVDQMFGPGKKTAGKKGSGEKSASPVKFKLDGDQLVFSGSLPFQPVAGAVIAAADQFREKLSAWMGATGRGEEDEELLAARNGPAALSAKILGAEDSRTKLLEDKTWADLGMKTPEEGLKAFKNGEITERGGAMWKNQ